MRGRKAVSLLGYCAISCALAAVLLVLKLSFPHGDDAYSQQAAAAVGRVHLACVVCADRLPQAAVMLKSAAMMARSPLTVHLFADEANAQSATETLEALCDKAGTFAFTVYNASFPQQHREQWEKLFRPCAAQRLFLPDLLPDVDSVLYVDTDTLFMAPPEEIWMKFGRFNDTHIAGFSRFSEVEENWYRKTKRHPFYEPYGINTGVMLANLTRWRQSDLSNKVASAFKLYRNAISSGDQDLLNIAFHDNREWLYELPCADNLRYNHCFHPGERCRSAVEGGVNVLHHTAGYLPKKLAAFQAVYDFFQRCPMGSAAGIERELSELRRWLGAHGHEDAGLSAGNATLCRWVGDALARRLRRRQYGD